MIPLSEYKAIHSRPDRPTGGFEAGIELSTHDEKILDDVWAEVAREDGVVQLPDQPTEAEIIAA